MKKNQNPWKTSILAQDSPKNANFAPCLQTKIKCAIGHIFRTCPKAHLIISIIIIVFILVFDIMIMMSTGNHCDHSHESHGFPTCFCVFENTQNTQKNHQCVKKSQLFDFDKRQQQTDTTFQATLGSNTLDAEQCCFRFARVGS